jgi:hypothetical protein
LYGDDPFGVAYLVAVFQPVTESHGPSGQKNQGRSGPRS